MDKLKVDALQTTAKKMRHSGLHEEAMELTRPLIRKRDHRGVYQSVNLNEIPASMGTLLQIEEQDVGLVSDSQDSGAMWMSP